VDDLDALPLTLYKRWVLRPGVTPEDVRDVVVTLILPAYRRLSGDVSLGLEIDNEHRSIVAVQRWASRERHRMVTTGADYERWWAGYAPLLDEWDRLVEFDDEWSTVVVGLGDGGG